MSSITFYIFFILFLAFVLLAINLLLAPSNPYQEKDSVFECGFHSFLGQNRTQFSISFFVFALLFLLFDLEILLVYPYVVSAYSNGIYGLVVMLIFFLVLTLGFAFELGKKALNIDTRQLSSDSNNNRVFSVKFTLKNPFTISKRTFSTSYSTVHNLIYSLAFFLETSFILVKNKYYISFFVTISIVISYFTNAFMFYFSLLISTSIIIFYLSRYLINN